MVFFKRLFKSYSKTPILDPTIVNIFILSMALLIGKRVETSKVWKNSV